MLENHSLAIQDKKIVAILATDIAKATLNPKQEYYLGQHALIPGLINAHGHAPMALFRGYADDVPLMQWLEDFIWPVEAKWVNEEFVYQGSQLAIAEMLLSGTSCFADMYFFPESVAKASLEAGIRSQLAVPVLDFPTVWAQEADEYIDKATRLHDTYRNSELISIAFGPHAPYTVSDKPLQKLSTFAEELDIPIHIHVHETAREVEDAVKKDGKRPLQRLADLGLITPRLNCIHATQLTAQEIDLLQDSSATVIHCPQSNLKLASGFCPVHKLLESGINVALGTDSAASNNDLDMFSEMQSAGLLAKGVAANAEAVPAWQALQMATINGAKALGLDQLVGSLEVGKRADITAVDFSGLNSIPLYNPVSHLVYSTRANQVSHVWVNGKAVVKEGKLTTLNENLIREHTALWQSKITST